MAWRLGAAGTSSGSNENAGERGDKRPRTEDSKKQEEGSGNWTKTDDGKGWKQQQQWNRPKDKWQEDEDDSNLAALLSTMGKQVLANTQQIRSMQAALSDTYLLPATCAPAVAAVEAGGVYHNKVSEAGKGHKLGPPHPHRAAALIDGLANHEFESKPELAAAKELMKALSEHMISLSTANDLDDLIPLCMAKETYERKDKPKRIRITIAFDPLTAMVIKFGPDGATMSGAVVAHRVRLALRTLLMTFEGAEPCRGPAPRGELERTLQRKVTAMAKPYSG